MAVGKVICESGVTVILGAQWGDEGKGKLVDILSQSAELCARCQGGNNAGHTIKVGNSVYGFHMLPSGLLNPRCLNLIGSGCVIHLFDFFEEVSNMQVNNLDTNGRILVSDRAQIVFDYHQLVDGIKERRMGKDCIGTTKKGIGPAYSEKSGRIGLRICDLLGDWDTFCVRFRANVKNAQAKNNHFEYDVDSELSRLKKLLPRLVPLVVDSVLYMNRAIRQKSAILVEGANASMLDIDFGTYPFVTSSQTCIGGVCTGLGIPPKAISKVWGLVKAYTTRVGNGPFPTEQLNDVGERLQQNGKEWGATTGRKRRCGWLDLVVVQYSNMLNGFDSIMLSKLDVLDTFDNIQVAVGYYLDGHKLESFPADTQVLSRVKVEYKTFPGWKTKLSKITDWHMLPKEATDYILFIENFLGTRVELIGVGQEREAVIIKD